MRKTLTEFYESARHLLRRLRETPLLLGWLFVGPLVALFIDGWIGLLFGVVNILLTGFYALVIRRFTPNPPSVAPVKRPVLETIIALLMLALFFFVHLLDFNLVTVQPLNDWVHSFLSGLYRFATGIPWLPEWALTDVYLALSSTFKKLISTLLVFWLLGTFGASVGLKRAHWRLTGILVGLTALFGLATGVLLRAPLIEVLGLYAIGVFVNALPEELFFRGLLLPRLEKIFNNPLNALVISALLFKLLHIPIQLYNGAPLSSALLGVLSIGETTGLIWGYLYLRTRSILPGTFWHAANANLGFIMMSR